ncbi:MAG: Gfo/Idh/MocA family oxidoreductase [Bacteroidales bacterium]|jgi:predicted dehydrogenase|nr:Gfo/Idh/MocA family oxidoreductase [Bacteroidales bacterium]
MKYLRWGVVGTNFISDRVIAGGRQDKRFVLAAVCSRTEERAAFFAERHGIPHTFSSLEAMAASPLIDAVYIATPNACHAAQSILFMEHGKHVLCEKAFASNAREVREMIATARRRRVTLMEAMKPPLTPNFGQVREALHRIGAIRRYFACYCQYSSRYDSFRQGTVLNAFNPSLSNGALSDIGIYTIYPMVALFGRPDSIKASGVVLSSGADGEGCAVFGYPGMDASVLYSKIADSALPTEIQGEEGNIVLDRINIIGKVNLRLRNGHTEDLSLPPDKDEYFYEVKAFTDTVLAGKMESAVNSWENSLAAMEIMDEIRRQMGVVYPADAINTQQPATG